jgi:hypothetical protein
MQPLTFLSFSILCLSLAGSEENLLTFSTLERQSLFTSHRQSRWLTPIQLDGGGRVWVVHHTIPLVEPSLPPSTVPRFFRGATEENLYEEGTRAVVWGDCEDGSVVFYEAPFSVRKNRD